MIFDIDGTLADNSWRSPYDLTKVAMDPPRSTCSATDELLMAEGVATPIFVSGRYKSVREETEAGSSGVASGRTSSGSELPGRRSTSPLLFMRSNSDTRKDYRIKHDILHKHIAPRWHVLHAIDDRQQVVDMWRRIGIECWQVAKGDF